MSSAAQQRMRRVLWAVSIAAVTATGAWYGAGLKTAQEIHQVSLPSYALSFIILYLFHVSSITQRCAKEMPC